ncbi:proline/glycine betaine transporter [Raoultella terrigena]|uniref:Proline/glycine betaine transporter n=1 Tax=Raoultella terrigena TaxID=577 RepID=A0A4U9DCX6_RAOTE|nr:proline/glycine betaine transporter [Raoultella terrigena]
MSQHTRPLNRQDYKTLTLAALGGALEFYDFIIFVFFAAVVGELFFPADIPEWLRQVQTFRYFRRRLSGASSRRHYYGPLWRSGRAQENVYLEHFTDGAADAGDRPAADLESMGIVAPLLLLLMRVLQARRLGGKSPAPGCLLRSTCRRKKSVSPAAR